MFRSLLLYRRLLATTFLVVFVNVFAGQCYCASLRQSVSAPTRKQAAPKPAAMQPGHGCCRLKGGKAKGVAALATKAPSKKHSGTTDDCCRKKATTMLVAPDEAVAKHLLSAAPALLPVPADFHFRAPRSARWDRTAAVRLVSPQQLPPKIPDIRIFIQSLTV